MIKQCFMIDLRRLVLGQDIFIKFIQIFKGYSEITCGDETNKLTKNSRIIVWDLKALVKGCTTLIISFDFICILHRSKFAVYLMYFTKGEHKFSISSVV